jgi:signal peptidase I
MARHAGRVVTTLLVAAGLSFGALLVLPAALGWQRYVIVSGSMTGTYDRGSLVLDEVVPVASLRVGDVITYRPPAGSGPGGLVTHRIVKISRDKFGGPQFRTKGDANEIADPWTFSLKNREQARVKLGIPKAGFVVAALSDRSRRMLIIGVPAALIGLMSLAGLWREAGEESRRRRAPAGASA